MKAAVYYENGGPSVFRYQDVDDPRPGSGEILIDVAAISIEGGDLMSRRLAPPRSIPHIVGYQASGTVIATGADVRRFSTGDRVATFGSAGAYAEQRVVNEELAWLLPDDVSMETGSTIPVTFGTADDALFDSGGLVAGEIVVIQGAAGGVGIAAVQLAKQAGATVIALSSSDVNLERLVALGADHPVNYRTSSLPAAIQAIAPDGADLVIDMAAGSGFEDLMATVRYRGRIVTVGAASGDMANVALMSLIAKGLTLKGLIFGREMATQRARAMITRRLDEVARGTMTMPIDRIFPLADAAEAHRHVETGHPFGRVLMIP